MSGGSRRDSTGLVMCLILMLFIGSLCFAFKNQKQITALQGKVLILTIEVNTLKAKIEEEGEL